ncbi:MAG: LysR family transcriptional regulator [Pseudomonadota bacterium]
MPRKPSHFARSDLLRPLRSFCVAARTGSMSRAAEELYLSQPSVSLQIRSLEEALGAMLFERRGPQIRLTTEGEILFDLARPLVEGIDALPETLAARLGRLESGQVNIAAGESTILYILPELVSRFRSRYPSVHVHLHNVTGKDGLTMIRNEEVDFAIGSMIDVPADIRYEPIYSFRPMLITAPDHPLANLDRVRLKDLSPYGLILPPKRLTTWRIVDFTFQRFDVPYEVSLEVGGWEVIKRYVSLDMGISIVTSICLTDEDRLFSYDMSEYFPRRSYGLVMKKSRFVSPQAQKFIDLVRQNRSLQRLEKAAGDHITEA